MQEKLEIIKSLFFDCLEWYVHLIYFERMNSSSYTNYHFEIWKPKLCTIMTKFHVTIYVISSTILGNHKTHLLTIYVGSQFFPHPHKNGILLPKLFWPTVRKKCSSEQEKLLKFEAEGQEFAKFLRSLEQFIQILKV